ncbi:hypothetical protein CUMW_251970, partial [Citrus unshiu]
MRVIQLFKLTYMMRLLGRLIIHLVIKNLILVVKNFIL